MKKWNWGLALLLVLGLAAAISFGTVREQSPEKIRWGETRISEGTWSQGEKYVEYACPVAEISDLTVLLQTHWTDYTVMIDGEPIYEARGEKTGAFHLFNPGAGQELRIRYFCDPLPEGKAIRQSRVTLGSKAGIYRMLVKENLYAVLFGALALLLGLGSIFAGFYMRSERFGDFFRTMVSLGVYILCGGLWVLTDSKILLLVTQKTGLVELVSFLAFYALPIPLLEFTKKMLPENRTTLNTLQYLFIGMLLLYVTNYCWEFLPVTVLIVLEHTLMAATIVLMLYFGFSQLRRKRSKTLDRILAGYAAFLACSAAALIFYYQGNTRLYSMAYVLGILAFIFFLADTAWIEICDQIRENANVALYAQMAYLDMMTGLRNRAAFMEETKQDAALPGALAYIMVDVNNLKKTNDALGHQKGDELIRQVARCVQESVGELGSCYRLGGDEFVAVLKNVPEAAAIDCRDRIRSAIRSADEKNGFPVSAAIGLAWAAPGPKDPEGLLRQADNAMYEDKKAGKAGRQM